MMASHAPSQGAFHASAHFQARSPAGHHHSRSPRTLPPPSSTPAGFLKNGLPQGTLNTQDASGGYPKEKPLEMISKITEGQDKHLHHLNWTNVTSSHGSGAAITSTLKWLARLRALR